MKLHELFFRKRKLKGSHRQNFANDFKTATVKKVKQYLKLIYFKSCLIKYMSDLKKMSNNSFTSMFLYWQVNCNRIHKKITRATSDFNQELWKSFLEVLWNGCSHSELVLRPILTVTSVRNTGESGDINTQIHNLGEP